ncbi:MAG: hypothetical protein HY821_11875 [Acidobacteria bacterium]|nr:hypothetical protein [Acidobacteriota bacterium]
MHWHIHPPISRRTALAAGLAAFVPIDDTFRIAPFQCDATPDKGEPNIWVQPVTTVMDPLLVKGVVIESASRRYVLAALDWCGVGGAIDLQLRTALARGAGTDIKRIALQSVHQHAAPYVEGDAYRILAKVRPNDLRMSDAYLNRLATALEDAVRKALSSAQPFDQVGTGEARVERVASARRILKNGQVVTRFSTSGKSPELAAEPEGPIDPILRSITFAAAGKPLVRLHYYATHPQTFCCDGRVSADFVGSARAAMEAHDGIPQLYFTGCGGDVTVGKYNKGEDAERAVLSEHLLAAMKASAAATKFHTVEHFEWRYRDLVLPPRTAPGSFPDDPQLAYRAAITAAFAARTRPLPTSALHLGPAVITHLPGEPLLEFQRYAQSLSGGRLIAVAGYGDISPGYLCPDEVLRQGGYEPSASNAAAGTEARVKSILKELLAPSTN